ncbi:hypothetical protein [Mycobacterium avium]|uniref:hypothetical protein n=1 Tax=Mycobacterium avium TaxID=1764 RepID=UPI0002EE14F6|nr:hypothetical protein [Mycobacterium avium]ETB22950.1 hypothetical protein O973_05955 [Mycobacterium avium subsp. avium 11-4751]AYJ06004.1 hypothetical protein DBO90_15225 [Mycobacterium avium]MDV3264791.1 hypothetical protein [Mycobacterium avium]QGW33211.1 Pili structural subunit [Mycobacterium avium subsp. avium]UEA21156.1 hypothetical protein LK460_06620 [Mycobacterium avium subsp. avium]
MTTEKRTAGWAASVVTGGALAMSVVGLADGPVAAAAPAPAPTGHWCPGDPWNPSWGNVLDWDWHQCHDWQHPGGPTGPAGWGPWGPPPAWAPPPPPQPAWAPGAQMMWNPTGAGNWGIWNNGVWTPL